MTDRFRPLLRGSAHVTVGGAELTIPWQPASAWIRAIAEDDALVAVALAHEGRSAVLMGLATGRLKVSDVVHASHDLISRETGFKWYVALKLLGDGNADILGEMTLHGVDPDRVSLGQWTSAVYRLLTRNKDTKERLKLDFDLELPPEGAEDEWGDGDDGFAAMAALERKMMKERHGGK